MWGWLGRGHLSCLSGLRGGCGVVRFSAVLAFVVLTALSLGGCASSGAPEAAQASVPAKSTKAHEARASEPWSMRTPFGIIYNQIPNEVVDYPSKHAPGTIVVNTSERRLYYVLDHGLSLIHI